MDASACDLLKRQERDSLPRRRHRAFSFCRVTTWPLVTSQALARETRTRPSVMCHSFPPTKLSGQFRARSRVGGAPSDSHPTLTTTATFPSAGALYFSTRQLRKWSRPLEVYKRPCLIKGNTPPQTLLSLPLPLFLFGLLSRCWRRVGGRGWEGGGAEGTLGGRAKEAPPTECYCFRGSR